MREYVEIIRKILARKDVLQHDGYHYQLPLQSPQATGAGKPLKNVAYPNADQPIYLASISPGGLRLAAEIADGVLLSFVDPDDTATFVDRFLQQGFAKEGARSTRNDFTVSSFVNVIVHDDVAAAQAVPLELIDRTNLIGPPARIKERLSRWKAAEQRGSLDMMLLTARQPDALTLMAQGLLETALW